MEKIILKNEIPLILKENKDTPRIALCLYMSINRKEKYAGEIPLIKALLFQGTKSKTGEELATIIEENGIDCYVTSSKDYLCFKIQCLIEDFKKSLDILKDIVFNSTFEEFEKEKTKIKGEILSDLDSPQIRAFDEFSKTIFYNHPYGNTRSTILSQIDKTTKSEIKDFYHEILNNSQKNITVVGDFKEIGGKEAIKALIEEIFEDLKFSFSDSDFSSPTLTGRKVVTTTKQDSAQAQVLQGWIFPSLDNEDCPVIYLMNTILGSSGLSSRLFLELREKKGLAYTVRSSYDVFKKCGCLWVYIGTNPVNIQTAIEGFKTEINKMKNEYVTDEELIGGKNNILGKRQFILETNIQQATSMGLYELLAVGFDFEQKYQDKILKVTANDIKSIANKYFTENYVLYTLSPKIKLNL